MVCRRFIISCTVVFLLLRCSLFADTQNLDQTINNLFAPASNWVFKVIFFEPIPKVPFILIWLAGTAIFLTIYFRFLNLTSFRLALRTIRGRYSKSSDPGEITHFEALSAALSATVGLGNIAGVAIAISMGGPGAAFWMILMGFFAMTTKFAECTLAVRYRQIDAHGKVSGGAMHYLRKGLAERGLSPLGMPLAIIFAVLCIGASLGGGNMFQINQVCTQFIEISGGRESIIADYRWVFGTTIAILVGTVIIGGITRIASVTSRLVPLMCIVYIAGALTVLITHFEKIPETIGLILTSAFEPDAYVGGVIGAIMIGIRRGTFSNEAGIGSAPIAHAAVKTSKPASEGIVALLEPFIDTVLVCSMTALVIVITGNYGEELTKVEGIALTSKAFASVISWFPFVLFVAVVLFAFSTMISWSYYGQQAWSSLFGTSRIADLSFKLLFCFFIIIGSAMSLGSVIDFTDGMLLGMCFPNLIGVYILLPVVKEELIAFRKHAADIDSGKVEDETSDFEI